jgi:hypothetical protein
MQVLLLLEELNWVLLDQNLLKSVVMLWYLMLRMKNCGTASVWTTGHDL